MVELVVSLTVMAIGVLGAVSVFNSSFAVAGQAGIRSRAVALTTSEIEALRAIPYATLPVEPDTVIETKRIAGVAFTVERGVTMADDELVPGAYKRATVAVSWTDHAGGHVVVQSTLLYPGGLGPHPGASGTSVEVAREEEAAAPQMPLHITAGLVAEPSGLEPAVDLSWTVADDSNLGGFGVRYATGPSQVVVTESLPPGSRAFRVTGLSSETTYGFEVGARSSSGETWVWGSPAAVTTPAAASASCSIGAPAIDPSQVERRPVGHGGTLLVNPTFSVNTSGTCPGLRLSYRPTKHTGVVSKPLGGSSGLRTVALEDVPAKWDSGTHLVELHDDANVLRATVKLLVCDSASACR